MPVDRSRNTDLRKSETARSSAGAWRCDAQRQRERLQDYERERHVKQDRTSPRARRSGHCRGQNRRVGRAEARVGEERKTARDEGGKRPVELSRERQKSEV